MISLTFSSAPPSLNNAYVNVPGRGRVPSKKLVEWKKTAGWELVLQKPEKIKGPVIVEIFHKHTGSRKRRDLDNLTKATLDLLVAFGLIEDDSFVEKITAAWDRSIQSPACRVCVSPTQPAAAGKYA